MRLDIECLLDKVIDYYDAIDRYYKELENVHNSGEINTNLEKYFNDMAIAGNNIDCISNILDMSNSQMKKLYSASRAYRRWMIKTDFKRILPKEMIWQFYEFIFAPVHSYDWYIDVVNI